MEMSIKLYKKEGTYFDKEAQKDKPYTNYYVSCNGNMIPVQVKYFPNDKFGGRDPGYSARVAVMSAFAEPLPEQEKSAQSDDQKKNSKVDSENVTCPKCGKKMRIDDKDDDDVYLICDDCQINAFIDGDKGEISFSKDGEDLPF